MSRYGPRRHIAVGVVRSSPRTREQKVVISVQLGVDVRRGVKSAGIDLDANLLQVLDDVVLDGGNLRVVLFDDEVDGENVARASSCVCGADK